jgi:NADP-dependent 3-hydroxy acid dehydrogenase YdfG
MKVIAISGATSGVGEKISQRFVNLDWMVIGFGRNSKKLEELESSLGKNFKGYKIDISNSSIVSETFDDIYRNFKTIDLFVNNAAVFKMKEFSDCTFEDIDNMIDINLKGAMYCTFKVIEIMKKTQTEGRIINIGSVAATRGIENQSIYCASKYGLNGFAEALNQELIKNNISLTTIFPGGINTPLWNEKNPYPGNDKDKILNPLDIVDLVEYIGKLKNRIVLKNLTIFPSNEWH